MTYDEIGTATGASVGSMNLWLSDMPLDRFAPPGRSRQRFQETCAQSRVARLAERELALDEAAAKVGPMSDRELLLVGAALYWAEGSKSKPWRLSDRVIFINSDATVIRVMLRWLEVQRVEQSRLTLRLSIHESADVEAAERYWSEVTGVGLEQFKRATLKKHNPKTVRHNTGENYYGCLIVNVQGSAELYRSIEAMWRGIARAGLVQT